jgi:4-hydroxy-3-methylbut-2-enyl diphosphate reductase
MQITIDESSGFCWGVVRTVDIAEETLDKTQNENVFVLGHIIHNPQEIERLENKGLKTISHEDLAKLAPMNPKVIIRAHGEPPSTYKYAKELGVELIDATCPLVNRLQKRVREKFEDGWQIVIFGKKDHAEIIGLRGVCNDECVVITTIDEAMEKVELNKKTILFSQTTMDRATFQDISAALQKKMEDSKASLEIEDTFKTKDTICHYVAGREDALRNFSRVNDVVLFVAGKKSSNGKILYDVCKAVNKQTYFIEEISEIDYNWFEGAEKIGITGATSTPQWYMEQVKQELEKSIAVSA